MAEKTKTKEETRKKMKAGGKGGQQQQKINYCFDTGYKFSEPKVEKVEDADTFQPMYFLRTHSKNNDPADVQTQIWQCSFEPHQEDSDPTNIVATCGGSSVCFIDVGNGGVVLKYNRSTKTATAGEILYAQVWSRLPLDDLGLNSITILAAAGGRSTVVVMHPEAGVCYQMFRTVPNKAAAVINSLQFHPKKATWLFCGHQDGQIQLWDVGVPSLPAYNVTQQHLLTIPAVARDVYNLTFTTTHDSLIAGCDGGLFAWKIDLKKVEANERLERTEFLLPDIDGNGTVLDSVVMVRDDLLAAKCALHGQIYIFSIGQAIKNRTMAESGSQYETVVKEEMMLRLRWSDTDNYYMNMGVDQRSCILVCGDDKGALWVYNLADYVSGKIRSPITKGPSQPQLEPVKILEWPELEDAEVEKARKLRLDTYDIVVDNCAVSFGGTHIVAVTSNNMVCIWKRGPDTSDTPI